VPVITIHALPPASAVDVPAALGEVTSAVAAFLDEEPRGTWAVLRPIEPGHYAEGEDAPLTQPRDTHPPLVTVMGDRPPEQVADLLRVSGDAVVRAFGLREGNVFVRFEPGVPEHLYWGD
jgi:phenylpyruvate tautomerase PptA (4-oxalocrotonate tautomerase family)